VFLHEVAKGAADRSYGVQVARLAGLPAAVVARAKDVLAQLESGETSSKTEKLIDDLPLFSAAMRREAPPATKPDALGEALAAINPGRADAEGGAGSAVQVEGVGAVAGELNLFHSNRA
jgi:DNA mismatch repair protein MutS